MDIKELDKKQLVLLTLLITFVVSIATGIVTVSLMNQMPKSVPQTINNVIQRTIEKVTTVEVPATSNKKATDNESSSENNLSSLFGNSDALVSIYSNDPKADSVSTTPAESTSASEPENKVEEVAIGQGVIVSDIGLVLVDSSLITDQGLYKVVLDKKDFNVSILKRFTNGFTILKISPIVEEPAKTEDGDTPTKTE